MLYHTCNKCGKRIKLYMSVIFKSKTYCDKFCAGEPKCEQPKLDNNNQ